MRLIAALLLTGCALLSLGCSRHEETQEKLQQSMDEVKTSLAEGAAEARKALAIAKERWNELRPEVERAVASFEQRIEKLATDEEVRKRLSPEALERVRARIGEMRHMLAEAKAADERGDTDLAVKMADEVEQECAALEAQLVERPDPPAR